jgi:hypothetical protein
MTICRQLLILVNPHHVDLTVTASLKMVMQFALVWSLILEVHLVAGQNVLLVQIVH